MSVLRAAQARSLCISARGTWIRFRPGLPLLWRNVQSRHYAGTPSVRTGLSTLKTDSVQENLSLDRLRRYIKSLNPHAIHPDDYIDASSRLYLLYSFSQDDTRKDKPFKLLPYQTRHIRRFPEGCRGFLYFYQDPLGRPTVSGLRFRIAEEPSQTGFDNGKDLQPDGSSEPWSYSLLRLASIHKPGGHDILERLYKDGLVNPADVAKWANIVNASELSADGFYPKRLMASFDQPFEVELSDNVKIHYLVDPDRSRLLAFRLVPVMETTKRWYGQRPYKGRCVIRLEKVEETKVSTTTIQYRFKVFVLKVLTPIQCTIPGYDGIDFPKEGTFICRNGEPIVRLLSLDDYQRWHNLGPRVVASAPPRDVSGRLISTLNPDKISAKDYLDFSRRPRESLWTSAHGPVAVRKGKRETELCSNRISLVNSTFGSDLLDKKGFLYYHQEVAHVPLSGVLRFRLADRPSATSFRRGDDLNIPGLDRAWQFPLFRMVRNKNMAPLLAQLVQDGLVTDDTISKCRRLIESNQRLPAQTRSVIIYGLDEPFMLDFDASAQIIYVLEAEECRMWYMQPLRQQRYPFVGKCLVRCEEVIPSSPNVPNPSLRTVRFRVVKILEPFRWRNWDVPLNDQWELPQEGALITRRGGVPAEGHLFDQSRNDDDAEADVKSSDLT